MTGPRPPHPIRTVAFLGTPAVAVPTLSALHEAGYDIPLVITRPDKRRGRGGALSPSPVKAAALDLGLKVTDDLADLDDIEVDLGVVVAYGRIIPTPILESVPLVNIHFSLLPRWRGAAPVERAVLAGDPETGVCLMVIDDELDAGAVYARASVPIDDGVTAAELSEILSELGTSLLLDLMERGFGEPVDQEGETTYAHKIDPAELEIDWTRPAIEINRLIRVGHAWTTFGGGRLKIWAATVTDGAHPAGVVEGLLVGTGDGALELVEVQPEGRARMPAVAWANGARPDGRRLG